MSERERLVELMKESVKNCDPGTSCLHCRYRTQTDCMERITADYMIAHGVTVQRWIPVTERLPDTIPCGAGMAYSEAVNVLTTGRTVLTAIWDGTDFIADAEFWEAEGEEITHWASVPLPPPEPPKEER